MPRFVSGNFKFNLLITISICPSACRSWGLFVFRWQKLMFSLDFFPIIFSWRINRNIFISLFLSTFINVRLSLLLFLLRRLLLLFFFCPFGGVPDCWQWQQQPVRPVWLLGTTGGIVFFLQRTQKKITMTGGGGG